MSKPLVTFSERFNVALEYREVSPTELLKRLKASGINLSLSTISQYKSGYSSPKSDRLNAISKCLQVSPVWLMGYDVPMEDVKIDFSDESAIQLAKLNQKLSMYAAKLSELNPEFRQKIFDEIDFLSEIENKDK